MGMLFFLVVLSAFFVLFSKEMSGFFKKWHDVYWVRVSVPLIVISWLWVWYDEWVPLALRWMQLYLVLGVSAFAEVLPQGLQGLAKGVSLFVLSSLPVLGVSFYLKRKGTLQLQQDMLMRLYVFSWVVFSVLLLS